ncbi:hypothetical protein [Buttiauxella gaviniae]|jgi:hypothetical protein|uniref:hypothetical protein n=1 Tax=Buttiauxella gaviniae TaxID=82990 RepID=UPI003C748C49
MSEQNRSRVSVVSLYDASRYHDSEMAIKAGDLHTIELSRPWIADEVQKVVDTTAEVLGKRYGVTVFQP